MFSVIIPLYNKGILIKRAIDSVLHQTYQQFEIIVVDDGSKDNSSSFVKEYNDSRVKYYYKENGGVSSARNFGIVKAVYEWIVFLDADDELLPNALSAYLQLHERFPEVNFLATRQDSHYSKKGFLNRLFNKGEMSMHKIRFPYLALWLRMFYASPGTMCINKKIIQEKGPFDIRMSFFEDLEFVLRIINGEKIAFSSAHTMRYFQEVGGLSTSEHAIEKDFAYYIPWLVNEYSLIGKMILYDNIELTKLHHLNSRKSLCYYNDMQKSYFSRLYEVLHALRQKLIRIGIL